MMKLAEELPCTSMEASEPTGTLPTEGPARVRTKLNFQDVLFFGREAELQQLKQAYMNVMSNEDIHQKRLCNQGEEQKHQVPAAILWGLSGTGKSRIVQQFITNLVEEKEGNSNSNVRPFYFIQGKNDETTGTNDPLSAIIQALDDFCRQLKNASGNAHVRHRNRLIKSVRQCLSSEAGAMAKLVPSIHDMLTCPYDGRDDASVVSTRSALSSARASTESTALSTIHQVGDATDTAWNRLQYSFVSFIKAIATKERPIIMFLDDLQWSSQVSMDLMTTLLSDKSLQNFFFVGSIRQDPNPHTDEALPLAPNTPVGTMLQCLRTSNNHSIPRGGFLTTTTAAASSPWTDISLTNMAREDVTIFLANILNRKIDDLASLASKVFQKSGGNVFFALQLLEQLERSDILYFSHTANRWEWRYDDDHHLQNSSLDQLFAGDTVSRLLSEKIEALVPELRTALIVASYIRFTFDFEVLKAVLENEAKYSADGPVFINATTASNNSGSSDSAQQSLSGLLESAVLDGILSNTIGGTMYKFTSDNIQRAASALVPVGELRHKLKYRIGKFLLEICRDQEQHPHVDPSLIFVAADHLNSVPTKDHLFSVQLNVEAGEKASDMGAIKTAAKYLEVAMDAFKRVRAPWQKHYKLALHLYQLTSTVELSLTHYDLGYALAKTLLKNAHSIDDKLSIYVQMVLALGRQGKHKESLKLCKEALQTLGEHPKRGAMGHIIRDMIWVKRYLRRTPDANILDLPILTDRRKLLAMKLMDQAAVRGFLANRELEWVLSVLKMIRLSARYGICDLTATAYSGYSVMCAAQGDQASAVRFSDLAKSVLKRTQSQKLVGLIYSVGACYVDSWNKPFSSIMGGLHSGYSAGMECGDFEQGFFCWSFSGMFAFNEGYQLNKIHESFSALLDQMTLFTVSTNANVIEGYLHVVDVFIGDKPLDWVELKSFGVATSGNTTSGGADLNTTAQSSAILDELDDSAELFSGYLLRLTISLFFSNYESAELFSQKLHRLNHKDPSFQVITSMLFYNGLLAAGLYRQTKKRKHLRKLRQLSENTQKLWKKRGKSCMHRFLLLKAELAALTTPSSKWTDVKREYDVSIMIAGQASSPFKSFGHVHEAALACELAGEYLLKVGQPGASKEYFTNAVELYGKWGATAKVNQLKHHRGRHIRQEILQASPSSQHRAEDDRVVSISGAHVGSTHNDGMAYQLMYGMPADSSQLPSPVSKIQASIASMSKHRSIEEAESSEADNISVLTDS